MVCGIYPFFFLFWEPEDQWSWVEAIIFVQSWLLSACFLFSVSKWANAECKREIALLFIVSLWLAHGGLILKIQTYLIPNHFLFRLAFFAKMLQQKIQVNTYIYIYIYIVSFLRIKIQGSNFYSSVELLNNSFLVFKQYYTFFYIFPSTDVVKNYKQHYSNPYLNLF